MNEQSIFATALAKKTASERKDYLDEACGQDAGLRAQVEELLAADAGAGSFLEHPPAELELTVPASLSGTDSVDAGLPGNTFPFLEPCDKPDRIGKLGVYEIIEVVGQGGMGSVFRAMDTKLSRIVAVKVMAQELAANPTAVKRFLREARSAAAVVHDHVVTIHAIDDHSRPPYLVMEFVQGQTLQQKIDREGALELRNILRIGSQMAVGLAAAHKFGLIHRDVKPGNILLENGVERVKITDFGLARAADDVEMTRTGVIAGTPQYMSPEQAHGGQIDFRSDLFSLGSVLYTMCTGRPAFRAETTMGTLRRVTDDVPRPIRKVNPEIPDWLEAIVNRLLAKNPGDRFQSATEVAELLSQHLAHVQNPSHVPRPAVVALEPPAAQSPPAQLPPKWGSKPDVGPTAPQRRKKSRAFSGLLWGLIALTFAITVTVFGPVAKRLMFNQGTLQFVGAQGVSQARIEIDRNGELIDVVTFPADRQITLPSGDYQLDVTQVPLPTDVLAATLWYPRTISVKRGQTQKIEISWMRAAPARAPDPSVVSAGATEEGWTRLFNGTDLTGWKVHPIQPNNWKVDDGVLVGTGGYSNLFSERDDYRDFELRVEARISENGNSGVMIRSEYGFGFEMSTIGGLGQMPRGMEVDLHPGIQPEHAGSIWHLGKPVWTEKASRQLVRPDRWFTLSILAQGNHLQVQIDGITVLQKNRPDLAFSSGHIVLLQQTDEKIEVRFRKIEIQELPPAKIERIVKRFGPVDVPMDGKLVKTDDEGWRIEMPAKEAQQGAPPSRVRLFRVENLHAINGACSLRGQIKASGFKEDDTPGVFGDWQTKSGERSFCGTQIRPATEWRPWSFKANKAAADGVVSVEILLQNESPQAGTVWIKDLELVELAGDDAATNSSGGVATE